MVDHKLEISTHSADKTRQLGRSIGRLINQPLVIALIGDLGSGKTAFVQGLAAGLDVAGDYYITSPTFTLINEYPGRLPLYHADLYRLETIGDLASKTKDELLSARNFGRTSLQEIRDKLAAHNLALAGESPGGGE